MSHDYPSDADRIVEVLWHISNSLDELVKKSNTANVITIAARWPQASGKVLAKTLGEMSRIEARP